MRKIWLPLLVLTLLLALVAACGQKSSTVTPTQGGTTGEQTKTEQNAQPDSTESITLTYAFFAPANTFPAVQMEKWAEELEKRTDGRVKVELFPGSTLLAAHNMYSGVRDGVADIGLSATSYEPRMYPLLEISEMPSGYPNAKVASQTIYQLIQEFPPEKFHDVKIITAFATEPSYVQTKTKISRLEDFSGQKIRISGSLTPFVEELGAAPAGIPQSEVPEALQTGIIDGQITSREILMDLKLAEMVKYVVDYPLTITTFVAVMNQDVWDSLPADVQAVIDELAAEMPVFTGEYLDDHVQTSLEWSKKEHQLEIVQLDAAEEKRWFERISQMQDDFVAELEAEGLPAKEYQQRLYELIEEYSK